LRFGAEIAAKGGFGVEIADGEVIGPLIIDYDGPVIGDEFREKRNKIQRAKYNQ